VHEFSAILSTGVLPTLGERAPLIGGIKEWIVKARYSVSFTEQGKLQFTSVQVDSFADAMAFDYERFALSSLETNIVALSDYNQFGSGSWPILKFYYSAFFAAHAILRSRGSGLVYIEKKQADYINSLLSISSNQTNNFIPGAYMINSFAQSSPSRGEVIIELLAAGTQPNGQRGVHESFWYIFTQYLEIQAEQAVVKGLPDAQLFLSYSAELKDAVISGGGSNAWLSSVRNKINYQHEFNTWMPATKKSGGRFLGDLTNQMQFKMKYSKNKNTLEAFVHICKYLAILNDDIGGYIAERSKKGNVFGQKWRRIKALA
jgi:hypothetical protein